MEEQLPNNSQPEQPVAVPTPAAQATTVSAGGGLGVWIGVVVGVVAITALAGGGYYFYTKANNSKDTNTQTVNETNTSNNTDTSSGKNTVDPACSSIIPSVVPEISTGKVTCITMTNGWSVDVENITFNEYADYLNVMISQGWKGQGAAELEPAVKKAGAELYYTFPEKNGYKIMMTYEEPKNELFLSIGKPK